MRRLGCGWRTQAPIYTQSRYLPPSKLLGCDVMQSVIGDGCYLENSKIHHSVVGLRSLVHSGCVIEDSLLMGADYYEQYDECEALPDCLPMGIGAGSIIRKVRARAGGVKTTWEEVKHHPSLSF